MEMFRHRQAEQPHFNEFQTLAKSMPPSWKPASREATFGQQTPRRWGWGTPLKKRSATRTTKTLGLQAIIVNLWTGHPVAQRMRKIRFITRLVPRKHPFGISSE